MTVRRSVLFGSVLFAAIVTIGVAADLIAELGFTEQAAREHILQAFVGGSVPIAGRAEVFKNAPSDRKVLFVRAVTGLAKACTQTADFKSQYAEYREANKPQPPADMQAFDEQQAEQAGQFEESLEQMQETMKVLPPDQQKEMQKQIEQMRKEMTAGRNDPAVKAAYEQARKAQAEADGGEHARRLKEWEQEYPVDPNGLIANRLREFLAETSDMDYTAKLVAQSGKMRFADPKLEEKSREWKMCFRAGKDATEAARTFAAAWLKELGGGRE